MAGTAGPQNTRNCFYTLNGTGSSLDVSIDPVMKGNLVRTNDIFVTDRFTVVSRF
jgi:hypothetical protein